MAELQTVAAVLDLLKVAYEIGKFVRKVKNADKIALDIGERIKRLSDVLRGVQTVLEHREEQNIVTSGSEAEVEERIDGTVRSCIVTLDALKVKIEGVSADQQSLSRNLLERTRVALRHSSIDRINTELEARIQVLSTDLAVLQLFDQTRTSSNIDANHGEVLEALSTLGSQVSRGNDLLKGLISEIAASASHGQVSTSAETDETSTETESDEAIETLTECLRAAEDVRERYTSEYFPDDRSERFGRGFETDSPLAIATPSMPSTRRPSLPVASLSGSIDRSGEQRNVSPGRGKLDEVKDDGDVLPLEVLEKYIAAYADRACKERDSEHYNQAEFNLNQAIRYSQSREFHHGVVFDRRTEMEEDLAYLYQKQKKWAEAVAKVTSLIRERSPSTSAVQEEQLDLAQARQNQLLASIYFDRHLSNAGAALSNVTEDIEKAEQHATRAFNKRWRIYGTGERPSEEADLHNACIQLLVRILESRDKTVEATEMSKLMVDGSSMAGESIRRISTATTRSPRADESSMVDVDKHDILADAIRSGDSDQISTLLAAKDLNLERLCKQGKTFLIHAVESSDESTIHRLLDPEVGADVNAADRRGLTALHYAAQLGQYDVTRCLLHHDAEKEPRDKRGHTPVVKAVLSGDKTMVQIFFDTDDSTLRVKCRDEWSLLHFSVDGDDPDMSSFLIDLVPDLRDAIDQSGQTALHHCAKAEKLEQAKALLNPRHQNGADPNVLDSVSRTPLYLAASKPFTPHREAMVRLLVEHGAEVDEQRPPPRARDYALKSVPRRDSTLSVATTGTTGTTSTEASRLSRLAGRLGFR